MTQTLVMDLFAPGMTALHRAGLAGLWMTLDRFQREGLKVPHGSWDLEARRVVLHWTGDAEHFFDDLLRAYFKIDRRGLIWFSALGPTSEAPQSTTILNDAVLGTFLQHGRTREADPTTKPTGALAVEIDDRPIVLRFR